MGTMLGLDGPPTLDDVRAHRDDILRIAARRGARNIRVFGSIVRGDARPDSDVDFLIDLEAGRTLFDLSELILDLEEELRRNVDVVEIRHQTPIAAHIEQQAVPL